MAARLLLLLFHFEVSNSGKAADLPPPYRPPRRARMESNIKRFFRKYFFEGDFDELKQGILTEGEGSVRLTSLY
jgi:hypothetical protein